jgi:hypothetical protein
VRSPEGLTLTGTAVVRGLPLHVQALLEAGASPWDLLHDGMSQSIAEYALSADVSHDVAVVIAVGAVRQLRNLQVEMDAGNLELPELHSPSQCCYPGLCQPWLSQSLCRERASTLNSLFKMIAQYV